MPGSDFTENRNWSMACACVQILCTQSSISQIRDLISAQPLPALESWESCGFVSFSKGFLISSHAQVYFEIHRDVIDWSTMYWKGGILVSHALECELCCLF